MKSCRAASVKVSQRGPCPEMVCGRRRVIHSVRPHRDHANPMTIAVIRDAPTRANTICGWPGNATTVETTTTGLIAGAASMKVRAAAPSAPSPNSRRATGTDPHSHPGRAAPLAAATSTAAAGRRGSLLGRRADRGQRGPWQDAQATGDLASPAGSAQRAGWRGPTCVLAWGPSPSPQAPFETPQCQVAHQPSVDPAWSWPSSWS